MPALMLVNRLSEASIYLEGLPQLGRAEQITLPEVKWKKSSTKGLGLLGEPTFPTQLEPMSAKIKWTCMYPEINLITLDPTNMVRLQVYGNLRTYGPMGLTGERPVVAFLRGWFPTNKMGDFKAGENVETECEMEVHYFKLLDTGAPVIEIDITANIYTVGEDDLMANMMANLGLV